MNEEKSQHLADFRMGKLQEFRALVLDGMSKRFACQMIKIPPTTIRRWQIMHNFGDPISPVVFTRVGDES